MLLRLAWRNLWRQPRRTLLNLGSIAFSALVMVALLSLQQGVYAQMKSNVLRIVDGYAQIQPADYLDSPDIAKTLPQADAMAAQVRSLGLLAAPRGAAFVIVSGKDASLGAEVLGVQPSAEQALTLIPHDVHEGRYLREGDDDAIVLGATLAKNLHLQVGDRVTLLGSAVDGTVAADALTLVGTFSTGVAELDRQVAQMPLPRFRNDFALDGANYLVIGGESLGAVNERLPELRRLAGSHAVARRWSELEPGLDDAIHLDAATSTFWYATLLIIVVFIILNTLLMTVLERTREFGMLLALGLRHTLLGRMVWLELILMVLLGLAIGMLAASIGVLWFQTHGFTLPGSESVFAQWGLPGRLYPALNAFSLLVGPAVIGGSITLAGLFPYLRIRHLEPVPAMRSV